MEAARSRSSSTQTLTHDPIDQSPCENGITRRCSPEIATQHQLQPAVLADSGVAIDAKINRPRSTSLCDVMPLVADCLQRDASMLGRFDSAIRCTSTSSAASSSIVTSECTTSFCDDEFDDDNLSDSRSDTLRSRCLDGSSDSDVRARSRLAGLLRHLLELVLTEADSCLRQQTILILDRLLCHVSDELNDSRQSALLTCASLSERLDDVISSRGLDVAIEVAIEAFRQTITVCGDGKYAVGSHVIDLLIAIESMNELLSLNPLPAETHRADSSCTAYKSPNTSDETGGSAMAVVRSEVDVQLVLCDDDIIDDATMTRRLGSRRAAVRGTGRLDRRAWLQMGGSGGCTGTDLSQSSRPSLAVRLVGWCLCSATRSQCLARLLADPGCCVSDLSLVKTDLEPGLADESSWLADALRANTSLLRANFRLSPLGTGDMASRLGDSLARHPHLRSLNVAGTGLDDCSVAGLLNGLSRNRHLVELDIGFNDFSAGTGCAAVATALSRRTPPLRRLRMRDDGLSPAAGVEALFRSVSRNSRLRLLDLSSNLLGDDGVRLLADALIVNRTLREISIENCRVGPEGCAAIARALRANCSLRSLQLSRNAIGDDGFASVADGLRYNRSVTSLGANQCGVGNAGLYRLLEALDHNTTINTVKLCYNRIGAVSVSASRRQHHRRQMSLLQRQQASPVNGIGRPHVGDSSISVPDVISNCGVMETIADVDVAIDCSSITSFPVVATVLVADHEVENGDYPVFGDDDDFHEEEMAQTLVYRRLKEVLHSNAKLKILLWGNRMDGWSGNTGQQNNHLSVIN